MKEYLINKRLNELCGDNGYLSNDKIILLFQEYEQDKLNNINKADSDARTLLILGNQRLVFFILKNKMELSQPVECLEEFSVGQIGLVKSVDTYNISSGVKFATYACKVIMNEIRMYYRKINSVGNTAERTKIFLDDFVPDADPHTEKLTLMDTVSDDYDFVEEVAESDEFERIIKNIKYLSRNEAFTIIHYFGLFGNKKKNQAEIADILKVSRSYVSRYYTWGLQKLKVLASDDKVLSKDELMLKYKLLKKGVRNGLNDTFCF